MLVGDATVARVYREGASRTVAYDSPAKGIVKNVHGVPELLT